MTKKCSKCSKEFDCCADARGCWCENYSLTTETLAQLRGDFANCLCPDCLSEYNAEETPLNR